MAVAVRGGRQAVTGVLLHTDQGSEYTAGPFRAACTRVGVTQSMGRVASALDNAVIESWHSTLEFELRALEHFTTKAQARARIPAWIEEYNHDRRHSSIGMISPIAYEARPRRGSPPGAGGMNAQIPRVGQHRPVLAGVKASPPGGLRPALTPAPGGTGWELPGAGGRKIKRARSA